MIDPFPFPPLHPGGRLSSQPGTMVLADGVELDHCLSTQLVSSSHLMSVMEDWGVDPPWW